MVAVIVMAVAVVLVAGLLAVLALDDDTRSSTATSSTSAVVPPEAPASTTAAPPTSPTTAAGAVTTAPAPTTAATAPVDASSAVWPRPSGPVYRTPVAAARGFAVDFVGFTSPIVGAFRQGDARSGEVDVRPKANGPVTTVLVRQLGTDGRWFVLGSVTGNINITKPTALARVASPVRVQGTSTAFEGTIDVEIRQDGARQPIGTAFLMGGANGEIGPFDGTVTFRRPTAKAGAILVLTRSADDGRVWEAATVRVTF